MNCPYTIRGACFSSSPGSTQDEFDQSQDEFAHAVLVPRFRLLNGNCKTTLSHQSYGNLNDVLLREVLRAIGVELERQLGSCYGFLAAKGLRRPVPWNTATGAGKDPKRVFAHGPKGAQSLGGRRYFVRIRCSFSETFECIWRV